MWMALVSAAFVLILAGSSAFAQKLPKQIYIQAQAMGEQQQMGRTFNITLIIEEFSPTTDQQGLLEAFQQKGNEGLTRALDKMHSKGRMSITGTLGYDVSYIRMWKEPDGSTKYRLVTNRPITFGEAWSDSRSMDYSISGVELIIFPDKKKNTGTLFPLVQLKLNKEKQLELETYQNPWKLVDVQLR
jgi:hypothetical protein